MAETVLYMRGPFPFGPEFGIRDELIRDAKVLLGIEPGLLKATAQDLEAYPGFLDELATSQVLWSRIEDEDACQAIARLIVNVDKILRASSQSLNQLLSDEGRWLGAEDSQQKERLSRSDFDGLKERMPLIIQRFPGLDRQAKAQRLTEATGLPLERIEMICDLRPVFDKDRNQVEGVMPYTTLKIVCKGVDGLPVALEAVLSQQDVAQLAKASSNAEKKLARLRELLNEKHLPIPRVDMTTEGDKQ
ncbi:MAG: hypothetical protein NTW96_00830 [Planctomycetia bacterium]|nr:hypothetical protein [Planctomycetia bacterium]